MEVWAAILVLVAGLWYWYDSLRSREVALRHCRQFCRQHQVQFLDQSVHVSRFRLGRDAGNRPCIRRFYVFEFSIAGTDRYYGVAVVAGGRLEYLSLLHPDGEIIEGRLSSEGQSSH